MAQVVDDARPRSPATAGRVPPHNLEAEESLLGAMLLSRDAIVAAVEAHVSADDYYKPAHGHVHEAITSLYAHGEPADPVTVAEELRRAGVLEAIGGPAVLISLQARTPSIGNASRYARIVEEHSLLRRLISVAGRIADLGYSVPDDVLMAIDAAEALVYEVAQHRVTDSMLPIRELLERHLDHIEALYERGQDIIGVPTGYIDLDQQLAGLQPSNLVIVGGRPGTGKALALDTPIPTPTGWTTMGHLDVGHQVLDGGGRPCTVTFATPVMVGRPCYQVVFDDGSTLVADADHQWLACDFPASGGVPRVVTTRQMLDEGMAAASDERPDWQLPLAGPLHLPEADLAVDPYALGCSLAERTSREWERAGLEAATVPIARKRGGQGDDGQAPAPTPELPPAAAPGGAGEHIPACYLRASVCQRLALLQGLLDADGHVGNQGAAALCLSDLALLQQARELVCSLGHTPGPIRTATIRLPGGHTGEAWRFEWTPLDPVPRLAPKAEGFEAAGNRRPSGRVAGRAVTAIRPVGSVPVRCITVDSPDHLYLAGESMVPTHNTSFALGMAAHAALDSRKPVLLFSLEMSHLELTQRLLCSEARVDAVRMRNGRLLDTDWPKISHAVGRLAESPIHIDDNPHLTVMEIRAKARRLKSQQGLGLIVVDYLQLMTGRQAAENRQVEVSEISRGLKILARELEVPVVALSQLSRNLEARADKRPVLADLRESGCLSADTRLLRADTGAEVTLGELFVRGERDIPVWSLDEDLHMVPATMQRVFSTGVKPVFELTLASGRSIKATANHPFLTIDGWTPLEELEVGGRIAVPRLVPDPENVRPWPEAEVVMLAHLLGGGCFAPRQPIRYTSADVANIEAVEEAARHFGITPRRLRRNCRWHLYLPPTYAPSRGRRNPIAGWLASLGLGGLGRSEKLVPKEVFSLPSAQIALFLRHLWATGGNVDYQSSSRALVEGVQQLLVRHEIQSRVAEVAQPGRGPEYRVQVSGPESRLRFLDVTGIHGRHGQDAADHAFADTLPVQVLERAVSTAPAAARNSSPDAFGSPPSRARLGRLAGLLHEPNLERLSRAHVLWDTITRVTYTGDEPVFDGTVEPTHNFVANGVTSSNSLEQDADVVIFLYRDELYNRESPDRGTAEVIVAKHRNGPTGVTQLAFLENYTRFANMARGV